MLIRVDAAGATHELLDWLLGQLLSYSVGFTLPEAITDQLPKIPQKVWQPVYDADGEPRLGHGSLTSPGCLSCTAGPRGCG